MNFSKRLHDGDSSGNNIALSIVFAHMAGPLAVLPRAAVRSPGGPCDGTLGKRRQGTGGSARDSAASRRQTNIPSLNQVDQIDKPYGIQSMYQPSATPVSEIYSGGHLDGPDRRRNLYP